MQYVDKEEGSSCESGSVSSQKVQENANDSDTTEDDLLVEEEQEVDYDVPVCTKCGGDRLLIKHKCKDCGLIMYHADVDDIEEKSVYTSDDSNDVRSWVAVDRRPKVEAESEDYDGDDDTLDEEIGRPPTPTGSVKMCVIQPRTYTPIDVAERLQKEEEERQEEEQRAALRDHLAQLDDLGLTPVQTAERMIAQRMIAMGLLPDRVSTVVEGGANSSADLAQRPLIRESDSDGRKADSEKVTTNDEEVPMDSDEREQVEAFQRAKEELERKRKIKKGLKAMRTMQTKRTERPVTQKEPIDYKKVCVSLQRPEVELEDDGEGGKKLSKSDLQMADMFWIKTGLA